MRLTLFLLGRYTPFKSTPGAVWGGVQRKIPRLTNFRKAAYLDRLLIEDANMRYLSRPCITAEQEATLLPTFKAREAAAEDQIFFNVYETKFRLRFPDRRIDEYVVNQLNVSRKFDV